MAYALTWEYNSVISIDEVSLLRKLKISYIPSILYRNQFITKREGLVIHSYKTREPQSYFLATEWLTDVSHLSDKLIYLYALSQRSLGNKNLFIPDSYLEDKYWKNPYLKHRDGRVWFIPELNRLTTHTKPKEKK